MYKKFLLSLACLTVCFQTQCTIKILESMDQKKYATDFYAWMIWKTSKEYVITYHPNETFEELKLEPSMAEITIKNGYNYVSLNNKNYTYMREKNSVDNGFIIIDLCHDIALGLEATGQIFHYYLIRYRASENPALFFTQKIMEFPELKKFSKSCSCCDGYSDESFAADKDGTMVVSILEDGTIAKIIPKRIPSKYFHMFDTIHDIKFMYKKPSLW